MKKIATLLAAATLVACNNESATTLSERIPVTVNCLLVETKADSSPVKAIEYVFTNTITGFTTRGIQRSTDASFGQIRDTLEAGVYECTLLGYNDDEPEWNGQTVTFDKTGDTFHGDDGFELVRGEPNVFDVTLTRLNSRVEAVATDSLPSRIHTIEMELTNASNDFHLTEHIPKTFTTIKRSFALRPADVGRKGLKFYINCFTDGERNSVLTIRSLDASGKVVRESTTEPFTIQQNKITRFTGNIFITLLTPGIGLNIDDEWDGVDEYELPE